LIGWVGMGSGRGAGDGEREGSRTVIPVESGGAGGRFEWSVHRPPALMYREIQSMFPARKDGVTKDNLLVVTTCQRTGPDLAGEGQEVDEEKDRCLEVFMAFGQQVAEELAAAGHWADYVDPCTGHPVREPINLVFPEVEALEMLLQYKCGQAGNCKIVMHPQWGSNVYPCSLFTTAPADVLAQAVRKHLPQ